MGPRASKCSTATHKTGWDRKKYGYQGGTKRKTSRRRHATRLMLESKRQGSSRDTGEARWDSGGL